MYDRWDELSPCAGCERWTIKTRVAEHEGRSLCGRCAAVFRAARVLLCEAITEEEVIVPTIALAARIAEGVPANFVDAFVRSHARTGLSPLRLAEGVLLVRQEPVTVDVEWHEETGLLRRVTIRAFTRSAKPKTVSQLYEQTLREEGASTKGCKKLCVGPAEIDDAACLAVPVEPDRPQGRRPAWPPPDYVGGVYELALGSVHSKRYRGLVYALPGRQSGRGKDGGGKSVSACVAAYVNRHQKLADLSPDQRARTARVLNRHVLGPCGTELPERSANERNNVLKIVNAVSQDLLRTEYGILESCW